MKKKPQYQFNNPRTLTTKGTVNSEVTSYIMDPVELAKYRAMPRPDHEKEKIMNRTYRGFGGGDIA